MSTTKRYMEGDPSVRRDSTDKQEILRAALEASRKAIGMAQRANRGKIFDDACTDALTKIEQALATLR